MQDFWVLDWRPVWGGLSAAGGWDLAEVGKGARSLQTCCTSAVACAVSKAWAPTDTGNSGSAPHPVLPRLSEGCCMLCVTSLRYTDLYTSKYSKVMKKTFFLVGWSFEFKELCAFHFRNLDACKWLPVVKSVSARHYIFYIESKLLKCYHKLK